MNDYEELYPAQEEDLLLQKKQNRKKFIKILIWCVLIFAVMMGIFRTMLGYVAGSQFQTLEVKAKTVYNASESWQKDGHTLTTSSGKCTDAPFSEYFSDDDYYAIVCDEQGNLQYALYSHRKIKNLNQPDEMEEYQKLNFPVLCWYAVSSYPPKGNSPFT